MTERVVFSPFERQLDALRHRTRTMPVHDRSGVVLEALAAVERSVPALLSDDLGWGSAASVNSALEQLEQSGYVRHVTPEEGGPSAGRTLWEITDDGKSEVN